MRETTLVRLEQRMRGGGQLWVATDAQAYADHVRQLLGGSALELGGCWEGLSERVHGAGEREQGTRKWGWEGCGVCGKEGGKAEEERWGVEARSAPEGFGLLERPVTKYEAKAREEGRAVWEFHWRLALRPSDCDDESAADQDAETGDVATEEA